MRLRAFQIFPIIVALAAITLFFLPNTGGVSVVINADDAGISESTNRAIIDLMENGMLKSASIIVPAPAFEGIAAFAAKNPRFDWGIHLTLTSEWERERWRPLSESHKVKSLTDKEGYFLKGYYPGFYKIDAKEAELELVKQIEAAKSAGIKVTHIDTHMFALFSRCDLFMLYVKLGVRYSLPILLHAKNRAGFHTPVRAAMYYCPSVLKAARELKFPIFSSYDIANYGVPSNKKIEYFRSVLLNLPRGISLVALHPAYNTEDLLKVMREETALNRQTDVELLRNPEFRSMINSGRINLTTWAEFGDL